jgi:Transposase DDE domain
VRSKESRPGRKRGDAALGATDREGALDPEGQALYRRRQQLVEPVFAHTKYIRRADRFLRRGLAACQAESQLIAATHNLLKLWRAGLSPMGTATAQRQAG